MDELTQELPSPLDEVIAEYLRAAESGSPPDRVELLAKHPDLAEQLRAFFADEARFVRAAAPLKAEAPRREPVAPTIRYFGDYELLEEIARGGMGVVYKARQTSLSRLVAVKMILSGRLADAAEVKRFQAEAEAAANLRHPGVVAIYEIGVNAGQHYYSMEYVAGRDLSAVLRDKPVAVKQSAEWMREIAGIVEFAHRHGVLHRDLKPSNVLIDDDERVRVADFGLAKRVQATSDMTASGQLLGTPNYMSPEQAGAQRALIGPATDVYSLGTILYELLTGRPPFRSDNAAETLRQVQQEEPVRPRLLNPKLPRDLETICLKCLEKEPRRRYPSALTLADELGRFLRGESILARPTGPLSRLWRWRRRKPLVAALGAVSLLAVAVALAALVYSRAAISGALADRTAAFDILKVEQAKTVDALADKTDALRQKTEALAKLSIEERKTRDALAEKNGALAEKSAALNRERITAYANTLTLARREWLDGNLAQSARLLDGCHPELRHWEWSYLRRLCQPYSLYSASAGRLNSANRLPATSDGKTLFAFHPANNADSEIAITDASTGALAASCRARPHPQAQIAISGDGAMLLSARSEHVEKTHTSFLELHDAKSGDRAFNAELPNFSLESLAINHDGTQWAASGSVWQPGAMSTGVQEVRVWSPDALPVGLVAGFRSLVFSPDGKRLLTGHFAGFELWETSGFTQIAADSINPMAPRRTVLGVVPCFDRDGAQFACAAGDTLAVFDSATGARLRTFHLNRPSVTAIAFGDGGRRLAYGAANGSVVLLDLESGKEQVLLRLPQAVYHLEFSSDGSRILTHEQDGPLRIWDARASLESDAIAGQSGQSHTAASDPGGNLAATVSDHNTVRIYDVASRELRRELTGFPGAIYDVAFSPDGALLAAAGNDGVRIWDLATGQESRRFFEVMGFRFGFADRVEFARQGTWLAVGHERGATIWDLATGAEVRSFALHKNAEWLSSARLTADGRRLATCGHIGDLQLWDTATGGELFRREEENTLYSLAFSHDDAQIAACGLDNDILIIDAVTGDELRRLSGHANGVHTVAFSSDGKRLVSAGRDGILKIWDAETGWELLSLQANEQTCYSAAFSSDCRRLITAEIGVLRVWDAGSSPVMKIQP